MLAAEASECQALASLEMQSDIDAFSNFQVTATPSFTGQTADVAVTSTDTQVENDTQGLTRLGRDGRQRVVIGRRCGFGAVKPGAIRRVVSRKAV